MRLFDLHGLEVRSIVGLFNALYCTMFPETPLIVTCGGWAGPWPPPPRNLAAVSWLDLRDWSQQVKSLCKQRRENAWVFFLHKPAQCRIQYLNLAMLESIMVFFSKNVFTVQMRGKAFLHIMGRTKNCHNHHAI